MASQEVVTSVGEDAVLVGGALVSESLPGPGGGGVGLGGGRLGW